MDPKSGTLSKGEARIRFQEQPFQVLLALLDRPGELVTREELQQKIWNGEPLSDRDHRLNIAVNTIREALRDSSDAPRYVETLPRRGYRFIGAVERPAAPFVDPTPPAQTARYPKWVPIAGAVLAAGAILAGALALYAPTSPPRLGWRRLTNDASAKFGPVLSDGARLYFRAAPPSPLQIAQVPTSGGQPTLLPLAVPSAQSYVLNDISPDRQELLLFGRGPRATHQRTTWEIRSDGTGLRSLAGGFRRPNLMPSGWTPDGHLLLGTEGRFWEWRPRRWYEFRESGPIQLTSGDPVFLPTPRIANNGKSHTVGAAMLGELQRFDASSKSWQPQLGGISAECVEYSRDGSRLVYTTHPEGELWVRNAAGGHPIQLTKPPRRAWLPHFSPDARTIAFVAKRTPDDSWKIYLVDPDGGAIPVACPKEYPAMDLAWTPDGRGLIYAQPNSMYTNGGPVFLQLLDLHSGAISGFRAPDGCSSPRASRDWTMLAAVCLGGSELPSRLMIYRYSHRQWKDLPGPGDPNFQTWSSDGRTIFYQDLRKGAVMKCEVATNRHVEVLTDHLGQRHPA